MNRCICGAFKPEAKHGIGQVKMFGKIRCEILFSGLMIFSESFVGVGVPLDTLREIVKWYEEVSK